MQHSPRLFTTVRSYPQPLRQALVSLLSSWGYYPGISISAGTPDAPAAKRIVESTPSLVVLPYHRHRDWDGQWVNGFGVACRLDDDFAARQIPILMPVDDIALHSSFPRELDRIRRHCPRIFSRLVVHRVTNTRTDRLIRALAFAASDQMTA